MKLRSSRILLVLLGWLTWPVLGADTKEAEARASKYYESAKEGLRRIQERDYRGLGNDVVKVLKLEGEEAKTFLKAIDPLVEASMDHWRLIYRDHYLRDADEEDSPHFWEDLGDAVHTTAAAERRKAMAEIWEKILDSQLTPEQQALWEAEVKARREKLDKLIEPVMKRYFDGVEKRTKTGFEEELNSLLRDAQLEDARVEKLKPAPERATKAYMDVYRAQALSVLPAWQGSFFRASSTSMENFEKRAQINLYIPGMSRARDAGKAAFDALVDSVLTQEDRRKMEEARKKLDARITKAAATMVELQLDRMKQDADDSLEARIEQVASGLALPADRRKAFDQKLAEGEKPLIAAWKEASRKSNEKSIRSQLRGGNREDTLKRIENGNYWFNNEDADGALAAGREKLWASMLESLLSAEELASLGRAEQAQRDRKARAYAHLVIAELDHKVRLLPEQRDKLEPVILEKAREVAELPGGMGLLVRHYTMDYCLGMLNGVNVDKLHAVLDEAQKKRLGAAMSQYEYQWRNIKQRLEARKKKP